MKDIGSILVVLDKPKHAQVALERARKLAAGTGAHLHLASFCWLAMAEHRDVFDAHQRRALKQSVVKERETWLRGLVLDAGLAAGDVTTEVVWTDDIAAWVAGYVDAQKVGLVIKSVHHSKTLLHTPLDWDLLRSCPVPLYLATAVSGRGTGNVLATIDLRHTDRKHQLMNLRVLDAGRRFVELSKGKLHCVHAVETPVGVAGVDMLAPARLERTLKTHARELLEAMLDPYGIPRARAHLPVGKVGAAVASVAERIKADLVVVGTSARRGVGAVLLGNSAEKILTRVQCDVLAVHP
jgi:universal stress protein E